MVETSPVRAWVMATRPKTLSAAVAPVLVGTGMAYGRGAFALGPALAALVAAVLIQIATNLSNDYFDFQRGGDSEDRVGPVRVTQAGILSPRAVRRATGLVLAAAVAVGVYLVSVAGWPVVVIGVVSILAGLGYTGGPFPLAYYGLGDIFVFIFFGLVAVGGTYYVQALNFTPDLLVAGAAMGALTTAILVVNNLRDLPTDEAAGKRTLAVYIGSGRSQLEYTVLLATAFALPPFGVAIFGWTPWSCAALLAGIPATIPLIRVVENGDNPRGLQPALGQTAGVTGLYGLLLALGFAFG